MGSSLTAMGSRTAVVHAQGFQDCTMERMLLAGSAFLALAYTEAPGGRSFSGHANQPQYDTRHGLALAPELGEAHRVVIALGFLDALLGSPPQVRARYYSISQQCREALQDSCCATQPR